MKILRYALAVVLFASATFVQALTLPEQPQGFVNDLAGLMTAVEVSALEQKLGEHQKQAKVTIIFAVVSSVEEYGHTGLTELSLAIFEKWKPGNTMHSSGIIVLVSGKNAPFRARITTGRGMEGSIPDIVANRIVQDVMKPVMHAGGQGAFAAGLTSGANALIERTRSEFKTKAIDTPVSTGSVASSSMLVSTIVIIALSGTLIGFIVYRSNQRRQQEKRERQAREEAAARERLRQMREDHCFATTRRPAPKFRDTTYDPNVAASILAAGAVSAGLPQSRTNRVPTRTASHHSQTTPSCSLRSGDNDSPTWSASTLSGNGDDSRSSEGFSSPSVDTGGDTAGGGGGDP